MGAVNGQAISQNCMPRPTFPQQHFSTAGDSGSAATADCAGGASGTDLRK
jgi:hypothetical protein